MIELPDDILAEYGDDAAHLYTSIPEYIRQYLIAEKRGPKAAVAAPAAPVMPHGARASQSGYKGVYRYGKRWEAVVYANGRRRRLGVYDDAETAARTYDAYLVLQADGDPSAAVNFPAPNETARVVNEPFVEQFASGRRLTDIEWQQWQQSSKGQSPAPPAEAPMSVSVDGPPIDPTTPLIDRPAKSLYRRDSVPVMRPDPEPIDDDDGTLS